MHQGETGNIETLLADIRAQLAELGARVNRLEEQRHGERVKAAGQALPPANAEPAEPAPHPALSEERLLAISAAVAAFLGERVRIRQVRLLSSSTWAQQGRVSVQASHWLHH
jgi:methylmalonyl-CoA carboxyltransferase large subunit